MTGVPQGDEFELVCPHCKKPFTAKLNPAYAPYGDYDQLMRLEEWYGRK